MTPGNWQLVVCGINHKTLTLKRREPLQIGRDEIAEAMAVFGNLDGIMESVIVSTCNRIEFYFVAKKTTVPFEPVKIFYQHFKKLDISDLTDSFYSKKNKHVVNHLFSVASGIDSMVLGETQILGQLKDAYSSACAVKTTGKIIHRLFHQSFRVGKMVRTETEMGKGACSVSSAAVDFLKLKIDKLKKPTILFVGINQIISLAASKLKKLNNNKMMFANRTLNTAVEFATRYNGTGHSLDELKPLIGTADIIITCTGSKEPVITKEIIDGYLNSFPDRKITILDMAVPRDVEIDNDYNSAIQIYNLEDINQHVKLRQQQRELAIPQAQEIINRKLSEFQYWFDHVIHEPLYNGIDEAYEDIRQKEIIKILEKLPSEFHEEVNKATRRMVDKLLQIKIRKSED